MELPISFFLDHAWSPQSLTLERLRDYPRAWAVRCFGEPHAEEIGALLTRYTQLNARRKPELLGPDTYSLTHHREAERVVADYNALAARALKLRDRLPAAQRDAYFQLVLFPILACANLTELQVTVGRNSLYAAQGRAGTGRLAKRVTELFEHDAELTRQYHEVLAGGRWNGMMCQSHIGYTTWRDPPSNLMPEVHAIDVPARSALGVAIEGSSLAWPGGAAEDPLLPELTPFGEPSLYIEVFNRGAAAYRFEAVSSQPWLRVEPSGGKVREELRLTVSADWRSVPPGEHRVPIQIQGAGGTVTVIARVVNPASAPEARGYVESGGYVAIEAAHHSEAVAKGDVSWVEIPSLSRTLSGVTALPVTAPPQMPTADSPHLVYEVYLFSTGEARIQVTLAPTLNFASGEGLRYGVSFDDERPQIVNIHAGDSEEAWSRWVSSNANVQTTRHVVASPGRHTVKLWRVDPGLVFQRVVVAMRELPPSYLGPPESRRV
jgi:hypothetical protein